LCKGDAARGLDLLHAERAVVRRPREHDSDRLVAVFLGERTHEVVNRTELPATLDARAKLQQTLPEDEILAGWNYVDMIWFDRHVVLDLRDGHRGRARKDLRQHARMRRRQVLDDDERHPRIGRQRVQERRERVESAGRRSDGNDRERQPLPRSEVFFDDRIDRRQYGVGLVGRRLALGRQAGRAGTPRLRGLVRGGSGRFAARYYLPSTSPGNFGNATFATRAARNRPTLVDKF